MNVFEMRLRKKYFDFIKLGTKRIELRLDDEKRKLIQLGDEISFFKNDDNSESVRAKVIGLLRYGSFEELFQDFDIEVLADKSVTKEELLADLNKFYSKEAQEEYGVLGIRFELLLPGFEKERLD